MGTRYAIINFRLRLFFFSANPISVVHSSSGHCIVGCSASQAILMGGNDFKRETFFFNYVNNEWTPGPDLAVSGVRVARHNPACGKITDQVTGKV